MAVRINAYSCLYIEMTSAMELDDEDMIASNARLESVEARNKGREGKDV